MISRRARNRAAREGSSERETYDSEHSSLSGSDFTLYSEEALSDDIGSGGDNKQTAAVGDLISIDGKKAPPLRPPPPSKGLKPKHSPVTKKRSGRRKLLEKNLKTAAAEENLSQSPAGEFHTADTRTPEQRRKNRRISRIKSPKLERKKSPQPKSVRSKKVETHSSAATSTKTIYKASPSRTETEKISSSKAAKKSQAFKSKKASGASSKPASESGTDIVNSLSIEEVRAAGDGASEENYPIELKNQTASVESATSQTAKCGAQSASIDSVQAPSSDTMESSERDGSASDSTEDSSSEEEQQQAEGPKSNQWLDFQAMADRITSTVKKTSTNMKKITDTTNVTKLVGGLIKEEVPRGSEGAWDKVDVTLDSDSDSSHEFEDDYDPVAEADTVGQAFGDYKQAKKKKKRLEHEPAPTAFEDKYNPEVDVNDPLASAFGDGYRTSKPKEATSCEFDDDFSGGSSKPKKSKEKKSATSKDVKRSSKVKAKPDAAKPQRPEVSPSATKPTRPSKPAASPASKPKRPSDPVNKPNASTAEATKQKQARPSKPSRPMATQPLKDHSSPAPPVDLLGSIDDVPTIVPSVEVEDVTTILPSVEVDVAQAAVDVPVKTGQPSNLDLLMGAANDELDVGFKDATLDELEPAVIPSIPKIPEITKIYIDETEDLPSRSSSADLLDAFEFFNPANTDQTDQVQSAPMSQPAPVSYLTSPQIKIIAASTENLTDDLSYLDSLITDTTRTNTNTSTATSTNTNTNTATKVETSNFMDDLDPLSQSAEKNELHIDTTSSSSGSETGSESGLGRLVRDDTMDFDEIMCRPAAENNISASKMSSEVWGGTDDSGIGVEFKATFSVDEDLADTSFAGNDTFESLIERYTDVADGKAVGNDFDDITKGREEIATSSTAVSAKRAMKFARAFSETIDEDDDDAFPSIAGEDKMDDPLSVEASTGLGLIINPMEMDREDADGEENMEEECGQASASIRHVWIDMSKPMPRTQKKPASQKEKTTKPPVSSIKLMSQEARQALQVKVKPVPRPKGRELQPSTDTSGAVSDDSSTTASSKASTKKLVTQGQADHLNLTQLKEHTTLHFEIGGDDNQSTASTTNSSLPALPPPPKSTTPSLVRRNPFNKQDSSSSEDEGPPPPPAITDVVVSSEINQNEDTEQLIQDEDGDAEIARPAHKWETLERVELAPLEEFRPKYEGHGWRMLIRKPPKKSLTKKRFWEEVYLRLDTDEKGIPCLLLYRNEKDAKKGAKELERARLNPFHQLSDNIYLQQYDQFGKCHSIKVLHVSYRERPSLRTDRVTEALPSFIKGYMKPNKATIFEHAATVTELYKFGSLDYGAVRMFVWELEDAMRKLKSERINTNTMYQKNEIVADAWDEYEACIDRQGHVVSHKARVRLFMLCFVSGMPIIEVGINDRRRRGKEIVRRHEIIPVKAENWITIEDVELHSIVKRKDYDESGVITFVPLDGSKFEFMRFRYRPKKNRELPLQIGTKMVIDREKRIVELRADLLIPGYYSNSKRKGQVPCENIQICFPIPEIWVYKFRVEKHQKMGSLHAAARKPGKVKGLERITTAFGKVAESYLPPSFIECSVGDAKYEHIFRSVVWRIDKLPRFNEGAYKSHYFALRLELGNHDTIPDGFESNIQVEFVMPHTTVSGTAIRSISCSDLDEPPEKWVHHHARYEYTVEIDFQSEIKQLLPDDNTISEPDEKTKNKSPVKASKPVEVSDDDDSSIEIDEDREDSDDTDNDSDSEIAPPNVAIKPAESQGYATLLDFAGDDDVQQPSPAANQNAARGNHLSELLDLTEVTVSSSPSSSPKPRRASIQQDDLDML